MNDNDLRKRFADALRRFRAETGGWPFGWSDGVIRREMAGYRTQVYLDTRRTRRPRRGGQGKP